jgi:CubicO group peptidase (beta-lactamase class C family)
MIIRNTKFVFVILLLVVFFIACCDNTENEESTYFIPPDIGDGWETASLNSVGIDEGILEDLRQLIASSIFGEVHSVVIVKDDKLVYEAYFPGHDFNYSAQDFHGQLIDFDINTPHDTHSATKSIISTLTGIAIEKGFINSKDDKIVSYLPSYSELFVEEKANITIEHLLTMSSGLEWNEWDIPPGNPEYDTYRMVISSDPVEYVLSKPLVNEPGTTFYYNGGTVNVLGLIISNASDMELDDFAGRFLFEPLEVTQYEFQKHRSGLVWAHGDIYITPRSMAKYGYLLLNEGKWKTMKIISKEWIDESTENHVQLPPLNWADEYGYLIWKKIYRVNNNSYQTYFAEGWGGQKIAVFPSLNMVVVFSGANYTTYVPCDEIIENYIIPAINN